MATSKQAEEILADEYLADLIYNAFLEWGEPAKVSEIVQEIDNPRITVPVVRRVLSDSPKFILVDRQWDLAARYLDRSRPTERNLIEAIEASGRPLSVATMATELSAIYSKDSSSYFQLINKVTKNENAYFRTNHNEYGLTFWLPLVDAEEEADVLFDNRMTLQQLEPFGPVSAAAKWSPTRLADATLHIIEVAKRPISHRLLGVLAWLAIRGKYEPRKHINTCLEDPRLVWLTGRGGGRWITRTLADRLEQRLAEQGALLATEEPEEVAAAPVIVSAPPVTTPTTERVVATPTPPVVTPTLTPEPAAVVEPTPTPEPATEAAKPLYISDQDLSALEQIVVERGAAVETADLLALHYEVVPGDPSFKADIATLEERLKENSRFLYVGAGRFREPNSLPLFVYSVPEFLGFPDLQFISMDGEIMDEEIEDEGFVGTLKTEIMSPLAQDVGDDEGRYTGTQNAEASSVRLVLKAHHKEIGTFPLCQVPDGFFPDDAAVVEIAIRDPNGQVHDVVVNHEQRLAFNLFGLYEFLTEDSGSVFHLHKTNRPYEFRFEPDPEPDQQVHITQARMSELLALREQAEESGDVATFDITCEILAHYPKGLDFVQTIVEINIIRRVTRRKLASILSNYHCFMQKPGLPFWRFDAKKRDLGTDRAKRKYIKR